MIQMDVIVVGLGALGCATTLALAERGIEVLALEQFERLPQKGSSHGETRVIRKSFSDYRVYGGLIEMAYQHWARLESACGATLLDQRGALIIGRPDHPLVFDSIRNAAALGSKLEALTHGALRNRFPLFTPAPDEVALFEQEAGFLYSDRCMAAQLALAERAGANLKFGEKLLRWQSDRGGVVVETDSGTYAAKKIMFTSGPWLPSLFGQLSDHIRVSRQLFTWVRAPAGITPLPVFDWALAADRYLYGFPPINGRHEMKISIDRPGEEGMPDEIRRDVSDDEKETTLQALQGRIPELATMVTRAEVCMYSLCDDGNFVIGPHPEDSNLLLGGGLQGAGFKYASALGETMADLFEEKTPVIDLSPFDPGRFWKRS